MLMKIWPGYRKNQLERMNTYVDEDNGKAMGMVNERYQKVWASNEFGRTLIVSFQLLPLVLGGRGCGD